MARRSAGGTGVLYPESVRAASDGANDADILPRWFAVAALAALAVWTFWDRWSFLGESPLPMGVDGFWYPVQLRSLLAGDGLYYPAAPLTLWLMAPLAAVTDPIVGAKLGAALAAAALPVTTYLVGRRASCGERAGGLLAAVVVATSAGAFYVSTEFVKNAVALPIGLGAVAAALSAGERPTRGRVALALVLLAATAASHALVLAFVLVTLLPPVALRVARGGGQRRWMLAAAVVLLGGLGALAVARAYQLSGLVSAEADWSFAALRVGPRVLMFRHEVAMAAAVAVAVLLLAVVTRRRVAAVAIGPAVWALAVALPWLDIDDPDGMAFRLRLMSFVPLAVVAPAVLAVGAARLSPVARMTVVMLVAGIALYRPGRYQAPVVRADPDLAAAVAAARDHLAPGDVVVSPERHLVFMNVWYSGVETRLRPPGDWRLIPMAYMSEGVHVALAAARAAGAGVAPPVSLHRGHPDGVVLVPEATWTWMLARMHPGERSYYQAWPTH